jgi:hypothetical protein
VCTQLDEAMSMSLNEERPPEEQVSNTEVTGCGHPILTALRENLKHHTTCPVCLVEEHMAEIRTIKTALERRRGIFGSKTHFNLSGELKHKQYIKMWAVAKIQCYQAIRLMETLRTDYPEQAQEWGILEAFENWEQAQDEASRVR